MSAVRCPAWCVRDVDLPEDEGWVLHHGRPIEWLTFRGTKMSLTLTATSDLLGNIDEPGPYLELDGESQDGTTVGGEFGVDDVQTLIAALRELVGLARRCAA